MDGAWALLSGVMGGSNQGGHLSPNLPVRDYPANSMSGQAHKPPQRLTAEAREMNQ